MAINHTLTISNSAGKIEQKKRKKGTENLEILKIKLINNAKERSRNMFRLLVHTTLVLTTLVLKHLNVKRLI